jgi:hypothetical protein
MALGMVSLNLVTRERHGMHSQRGRWEREHIFFIALVIVSLSLVTLERHGMHSQRGRWERE